MPAEELYKMIKSLFRNAKLAATCQRFSSRKCDGRPMSITPYGTDSKQQPFVPFRIHLSDSRVFDVRHREMVWVGREAALLGFLTIDGYLERAERIVLAHIVRLEPLPTISPAE